MLFATLLFALFSMQDAAPAPRPMQDVFVAGERGYHTFRIPAIVQAQDGALLAFAEGRVNGSGDSGDIDIVMKRSADSGATWGPLQVVADNGPGAFGNPAPVVDAKSGDVVLLCVRQAEGTHEGDIRASKQGSRTPYLLRSSDGGRLWSSPESLFQSADREDWRWYATGPCHAIQLQYGEHAGRLVVPANHSVKGGAENSFLGAHLLLSDDGGYTWRIGAVDDSHVGDNILNPSECAVAELPDGRLFVSTRDQHGTSAETRAGAWSLDGGVTLAAPFTGTATLPGPVCQGALLFGEQLMHAGPSDPGARRRLTICRSADGGATWSEALLLYADSAAYCDLVELAEGRYGCLLEADGYKRITFAPFGADEFAD